MMDIDVTQELLTLAKANYEVFMKLLEFLIAVYQNKHEGYKAGFVDPKTFFRQNEPAITTNSIVPNEILSEEVGTEKYKKMFEKCLKQCGVAVLIKEKDGKSYFMCAESKLEAFNIAYGQYLKWRTKEEMKEQSMSQEVGGENKQELQAIQERNEKIDELYHVETKDGIKVDVPYDIFLPKEAIQNAIRKTNSEEAHFSKKNLKAIMNMNTTNKDYTGDDIIIGKDNKTLNQIIEECDIKKGMSPEERRREIAEKIKEEIGSDSDKNFISLHNNKGIFFKDNNHNLCMIDLMSMKLRVTPDQFFNGKPLYAYMQKIIVAAKKYINDRNEILETMTAGKEFSKEKMQFMKQLSEGAISIEETIDHKGQRSWNATSNDEIEKNYFAVWNYMTSKENKEHDVTDKDRAMLSSIQNHTFDKRMALEEHIDAESCWIISDAIQEKLDKEVIDYLFSEEIDNDERRIIVDISKEAKEKDISYTVEELKEFCDEAKEKIVDIRYFNATDKFAEKPKTTYEGIKTDLAQRHIEEMQVSDKVVAAIDKTDTSKIAFKDANGEPWFEAYKDRKTGNKVFVNEDKSKAIYESVISEDVSEEKIDTLKEKNKKAFDTISGAYYKDGKNKYVTENGKKVLHKPVEIKKVKEQQQPQQKPQKTQSKKRNQNER